MLRPVVNNIKSLNYVTLVNLGIQTKNTSKGIHALVKIQMEGKKKLRLLSKGFFRFRTTTL